MRAFRNRISAKRSRLRKTSMIQALVHANKTLVIENGLINQHLKQLGLINAASPRDGPAPLPELRGHSAKKQAQGPMHRPKETVRRACSAERQAAMLVKVLEVCAGIDAAGRQRLLEAVDAKKLNKKGVGSFCVTDCMRLDNPLVFVSDPWIDLTGYESKAVLGRNCSFLQGPLTSVQSIAQLRRLVKSGQEGTVVLVNYKKNQAPFWNQVTLTPLRNEKGQVSKYMATVSEKTRQAVVAQC